jgi:hypothetical protein
MLKGIGNTWFPYPKVMDRELPCNLNYLCDMQ